LWARWSCLLCVWGLLAVWSSLLAIRGLLTVWCSLLSVRALLAIWCSLLAVRGLLAIGSSLLAVRGLLAIGIHRYHDLGLLQGWQRFSLSVRALPVQILYGRRVDAVLAGQRCLLAGRWRLELIDLLLRK